MGLATDLSNLPRATEAAVVDGVAPDPEPRFAPLLAEKWMADDLAHPHVRGSQARFWHSDAGKCARAIAYKAAGIPASNLIDLSGINNVRLGSLMHEAWQEAAVEKYGDKATLEERVFTLDGDGTGRIDLAIRDEHVIAVELKSIGGFGYKAAIGKAGRGRPAEGPKAEHLLQVALNGSAINADEVVVSYLAKEAISVNAAGRMPEAMRFSCDWTYARDDYEPLANRELSRIKGILDLVDEGTLAARKMPGVPGEIVDVAKGRWEKRNADDQIVDTGTYWACGYCSHRDLCAQTDSGRIPIEQAVAISTKPVAA